MVDQIGGKYECFQSLLKKIQKLEVHWVIFRIRYENKKNLTLWTLKA